jgi:hypothetical protein
MRTSSVRRRTVHRLTPRLFDTQSRYITEPLSLQNSPAVRVDSWLGVNCAQSCVHVVGIGIERFLNSRRWHADVGLPIDGVVGAQMPMRTALSSP